MSAEEAKHRTYQESDGVCHARGAIAFRLWRATLYPVEITSGQNFGEGQARLVVPQQNCKRHVQSSFLVAKGIIPANRRRSIRSKKARQPCAVFDLFRNINILMKPEASYDDWHSSGRQETFRVSPHHAEWRGHDKD
jgi:hypothetical protein